MDKSKELVLVTGASGYIASHLTKQLLEQEFLVRGTVRSLKDEKKVAPLRNLMPTSKYPLELVEADLLNQESWLSAVKDCTYVMHVASPFPSKIPENENELIEPAVLGTLSVLKACVQEESQVKRVILTSSVAAIMGDNFNNGHCFTEKDWPDLKILGPYAKSKNLSEKAAWKFIQDRKEKGMPCFELAVINPAFVMGPLLHDTACTSIEFVERLMMRKIPLLPRLSLPVCDVRDVALAHIRAMLTNEAVNNRHIIASQSDFTSIKEIATMLDTEFRKQGFNVPTSQAPDIFIKVFSIFDKPVRQVKSF